MTACSAREREKEREQERTIPIYSTQKVKKKALFFLNTVDTQVRVEFRIEENREP